VCVRAHGGSVLTPDPPPAVRAAHGACVRRVTTAPWRAAGADISDFFNYGLTERSWRAYQVGQRELLAC
jgi:hypothetical protein